MSAEMENLLLYTHCISISFLDQDLVLFWMMWPPWVTANISSIVFDRVLPATTWLVYEKVIRTWPLSRFFQTLETKANHSYIANIHLHLLLKIFFFSIMLYAEADCDLLANELIYDFEYKEEVLCLYIILRGIVFSVCCLL